MNKVIEPRSEVLFIRITPSDKARILEKMSELGISNMSAYVRKMALDGYCIHLDFPEIREMIRLLRNCTNNLNQYARQANAAGSIYRDDIHDLQQRLDEIWEQAKKAAKSVSELQ